MTIEGATPDQGQSTRDYWLQRRNHLFVASCFALIVTAMSFAIRGDVVTQWKQQFHLTNTEIGWIAGTAFWGFTLAIIIGGPLCDIVGMGRLLYLAIVGHAAGILITIFAGGFWGLFTGTLAIGLANGCVEAACNPLLAGLYPDQKIRRLNLFHVWFPGGIVIGGLVAAGISAAHWGGDAAWKLKMATMLIPLIVYAIMIIGREFPATERHASGVTTSEMFVEAARPFFILFVLMMLMTAATELVTEQWIPNILTMTTGVVGILYVVWINGLMAVGRSFAGPIVNRISPISLLIGSSVFSAVGVVLFSQAHSAAVASLAATLFGIGVCYYWPTMLGVVNERFPKTGALGLAIMGGAGNLSVSVFMLAFGRIYDLATASAAGGAAAVQKLQAAGGTAWTQAQAVGGAAALGKMVYVPIALCVLFTAIYLFDRSRGGYQKEVLGEVG